MDPKAERNLEVAKAYLERIGHGDLGVVDEVMDEEVVLTIVSAMSPHTAHAIPWAGEWRGRQQAKDFNRRLTAGQRNRVDKVDRWLADNRTVVAFATLHAASPVTGRSGSWEIAIRFDFDGPLISRYWVYEDSFSAVVMHSTGGELAMHDVEGSRKAPASDDV